MNKTYVIIWYDGNNQQVKTVAAEAAITVLADHADTETEQYGAVIEIGAGGLESIWLNNGNGWELQDV